MRSKRRVDELRVIVHEHTQALQADQEAGVLERPAGGAADDLHPVRDNVRQGFEHVVIEGGVPCGQ